MEDLAIAISSVAIYSGFFSSSSCWQWNLFGQSQYVLNILSLYNFMCRRSQLNWCQIGVKIGVSPKNVFFLVVSCSFCKTFVTTFTMSSFVRPFSSVSVNVRLHVVSTRKR